MIRYFVFTSKHHDGFANWPSTHNFGWNSVAVGPERDVVGELAGAFREFSPEVHFGLYYSLYEWFHPKYLLDKESGFATRYEGAPKSIWALIANKKINSSIIGFKTPKLRNISVGFEIIFPATTRAQLHSRYFGF